MPSAARNDVIIIATVIIIIAVAIIIIAVAIIIIAAAIIIIAAVIIIIVNFSAGVKILGTYKVAWTSQSQSVVGLILFQFLSNNPVALVESCLAALLHLGDQSIRFW